MAEDKIIEGVIWINPERVSGTPCFMGTRVPVKTLFDYLSGGYDLERFLDGFPTVTLDQAQKVIKMAESSLYSEALGVAA